MASFQEAISKTLLWEGGYSNDPADSGGETYEGISRHNWPAWNGWGLIDPLKGGAFPTNLGTIPALAAAVVQFYHDHFWSYDGIEDQLVADKIFDMGVNIGQATAIKITQRAVGTNQDGCWGPNTERLVNSWATLSGSLLAVLRAAAEAHHKEIVQDHPEDAKFLAGWLRRDKA